MKFLKKLGLASALIAAPFMATTAFANGHGTLKYVLVSHAPDSDSWWNTIKNGIALAGDQMGVEVEYRNPPTGDLADMARIIEQAAASGPNGIITTLADYDVLSGAISSAVDSGVDVIHNQLASKEHDRVCMHLQRERGERRGKWEVARAVESAGDAVGNRSICANI